VDTETYLRHLRGAGEAMADVAAGNLSVPVPTCPEFDLGGLLAHTGYVLRWISACAESGELARRPPGDPPDDPEVWHRDGLARALAVLGSVDPDAPCWSWGSDQHCRFWIRRAAQELAVHSWDASNAVGVARPIDPALAADGIDELFGEFVARRGLAAEFGGEGQTMHLHATDTEGDAAGEWLVRLGADAFDVTHEHAKADVAARGTASDLLLFLWGRVDPSALEVFGDAALLDRWRQRVRI
jgi:uncharacterized protein (TIGR03083 family)